MGKIQSDPSLLSLSAFLVLVVEIKKKNVKFQMSVMIYKSLRLALACERQRERRGFLIAHCKTEKPFGKSERI